MEKEKEYTGEVRKGGLAGLFSLGVLAKGIAQKASNARLIIQAVRLGEEDAAISVSLSTVPDVSIEVTPAYSKVIEAAFKGARRDIKRAAR